MASPSLFKPHNYSYNVFSSFHGPDVRKTLLSHIREQFNCNGITMFDDEKIVRSATIASSLTKAIKESRISIVILSRKYASSSWCLDELVEILKCKKAMGQIVMTIFYGVDPSDVQKQIGEFGIAFHETCACKSDEERKKWSQALKEVGNIAGEDFLRWDNEANMIKKIAKDVLDKKNATPSRDFDGIVGLEAHLKEMEHLLDLDYDGVKMVAITGPAGIGKTTIARALHGLLSSRFQFSYFMENHRESYHNGFDEYGLKLHLQELFLAKVLNQNGIKICHLGAIKENLSDQRVLVVLDDVDNVKQLEALANDTTWFGPGSRIVVTTENKELLQTHGIDTAYNVDFPSRKEALHILCMYAFRKTSLHPGFKVLAERITQLCGKLPLALRVVGLSLRGKKEDEWEDVASRLETILERDIEDVLRVGYECLNENEQNLFLHIAIFFNNEDVVKAMFDEGNLDVKRGLKILVNRSLISICGSSGNIVMHKLLQQMARQTIRKQEPWKRQIFMDSHEICDVLENETGTRAVSGISFDLSDIEDVSISERALKRMSNLQFLRVYKTKFDKIHIPEKMEFPRRLRLLDWESYPRKSLPPTFHPEYLVELNMQDSQLEYLWQGTQMLKNLKKMNLLGSLNLKELPDLSNATNLETLDLSKCKNLQFIPAHMNLTSLVRVFMYGCSRLSDIPVMSKNIEVLHITETAVEDEPQVIRFCSRLKALNLSRSVKLKGLTYLPKSVTYLDIRFSGIERIPDCIKALHMLEFLLLSGCRRLTSLPELPVSLKIICAENCESLEAISSHFSTPVSSALDLTNCFKLDQQARRTIIQQSLCFGHAILPGKDVPAEFDHRAKGNFVIIPFDVHNPFPSFSRVKVCVVVSPHQQITEYSHIPRGYLHPVEISVPKFRLFNLQTEHLLIFVDPRSLFFDFFYKVDRDIVVQFRSNSQDYSIIECGVQIVTDEWSYESVIYQELEENIESETSYSSENDTEYDEVICDSKED